MFRRYITLLLLAGFIASHLATIPHAHGAMSTEEQREHDATPHFHCPWLGHSHHDPAQCGNGHSPHGSSHAAMQHSHGHRHTHGSHVHGAPQPRKAAKTSNSPPKPQRDCVSGETHDATAVFTPGVACTTSPSLGKDLTTLTLQLVAAAALTANFEMGCPASLAPLRTWHPPDIVLDGSDVYLTLRNLRI